MWVEKCVIKTTKVSLLLELDYVYVPFKTDLCNSSKYDFFYFDLRLTENMNAAIFECDEL